MQFSTLTQSDIQSIYFELKNQKAMKSFFGDYYKSMVEPLIKSKVVLKPTEYLNLFSDTTFLKLLSRYDGSRNMASHYGVSIGFIRARYRAICANVSKREDLTKEILLAGLERTGSVRMFCRLYSYKESEVRKCAKDNAIEVAPYLNFEVGDYQVNRGRRAEIYYKSVRGDAIQRDLNEGESSQAAYDFDDTSFGKVNVKASKRYRFKAKCRRKQPYYWVFSAGSLEKCDYVAVAFYDPHFENPIGWGMVSSAEVLSLEKKTFTIRQTSMSTPDEDGRISEFLVE